MIIIEEDERGKPRNNDNINSMRINGIIKQGITQSNIKEQYLKYRICRVKEISLKT